MSILPIDSLLEDSQISEILINGTKDIWVEKNGILSRTSEVFADERELENFIRNTLLRCGRKIDRRTPFADARLPNGSRFCAVMDPAVHNGYHVSIRKFNARLNSLHSLRETGFSSPRAETLLRKIITERKNILVSGATGTGKTTLLNTLVSEISGEQRIIILEDTFEMQPQHPHVVRFEARPANNEGEGEITLRQLLRTALRMRPDRLILGECRGAEVAELLQALNTGHQGSMATIHANSARDALHRLELLFLLHLQGVQSQTARQFISSSIQYIIHLDREAGRRKLQGIYELTGCEEGVFLLRKHEI